jgi:hypothetical protein
MLLDGNMTRWEAVIQELSESYCKFVHMGNGILFKLLQAYDAPVVVIDSVYRPTMKLIIEIRTHRLFGE